VKGLNLEIEDGEFLVLLGPSGCGKTTALRMVAGLESVTSGRIAIGPRDVTEVLPKYRDVAMVFQSYALYPHMTVAKNIGYPLKLRGVPQAEQTVQIRAAAEKVHLEDYLERYPRQLSGGQRQRVALARAIVRRPSVFLMDEPLSNLDAKLRSYMRAELKRLQGDLGTTTIYVTHDQIEAMTLAHRVAVMNKGVVQQIATPREIYDNPANLFVAGFIGSPPILPTAPLSAPRARCRWDLSRPARPWCSASGRRTPVSSILRPPIFALPSMPASSPATRPSSLCRWARRRSW
jgi:multiple sugar transport system ATP-binding protein